MNCVKTERCRNGESGGRGCLHRDRLHQLQLRVEGGVFSSANERGADVLGAEIAANNYDLGELLAGLMDAGELRNELQPQSLKLAYQAPCHLKSQGIGRPWLRLLRSVPGVEVVEMKADCCGMAGTYGLKREKYRISMNIGRELFERIGEYKPAAVVTECGTCQMQIEHGTGLKALHPAEIFYAACRPPTIAPPPFGPRAGQVA